MLPGYTQIEDVMAQKNQPLNHLQASDYFNANMFNQTTWC